MERFDVSYMVLNGGKCHYMCLWKATENAKFSFDGNTYSKEEKILGIIFDNDLLFYDHIKEVCKKASQEPAVLSHLAHYLEPEERRLIFNPITKAQFTYCPLVWMFYCRTSNNLINKTHERSFGLILNDHESSFVEALRKNNDVINHQRNIQILLTEAFKENKSLAPPIMEGMFNAKPNNENLRYFQELVT